MCCAPCRNAGGAGLRAVVIFLALLILVYVASYVAVRSAYAETWATDGVTYVMFHVDGWLYYLFRPATYVDATLTGQQFHLGPHQ
jgi:hypothetical protein